jgi:hypothetical protein
MKRILAAAAALVAWSAAADTYQEQVARIKALDERCEAARAAKLAPTREELAQRCAGQTGRSLDECRREASTYGDRSKRGLAGPARGYDAPECKEAAAARRAFESSMTGQRK